MKHSYRMDGLTYKLRPVKLEDAQTVLDIRLEDAERNQYVHPVKNDVELERQWLLSYFERQGDYFFAVVNKFTDETEGLIAIYDEKDGRAEWGRWTIRKGSLAATESVYLLYEVAFSVIGLNELYCRTIADNDAVVEFHKSEGLRFVACHKDCFELNGRKYDAIEQALTADEYEKSIKNNLYGKALILFRRNMRLYSGGMDFHHIGVVCTSIKKDKKMFQMLGYSFEPSAFEDKNQGIKGIFGTAKNQPCVELLENLEGSAMLTPWLEKGIKMYHFGYFVVDMEKACFYMEKIKAKIVSPLKESVYFGKRICFYMLPNMMLVELIERHEVNMTIQGGGTVVE